MESFTPWSALAGGALIGASASLLLWLTGRIAGVSGIAGGLTAPVRGEILWRVTFLLGLALGGYAVSRVYPPAGSLVYRDSPLVLALAGLLVGYGTRLGGGCTSGHGVCGVSRGSVRSMVATAAFMTAGILTVLAFKTAGGVP